MCSEEMVVFYLPGADRGLVPAQESMQLHASPKVPTGIPCSAWGVPPQVFPWLTASLELGGHCLQWLEVQRFCISLASEPKCWSKVFSCLLQVAATLMGCAVPMTGDTWISRQCLGQALRPPPWESPAVLEMGRQPHLEGDFVWSLFMGNREVPGQPDSFPWGKRDRNVCIPRGRLRKKECCQHPAWGGSQLGKTECWAAAGRAVSRVPQQPPLFPGLLQRAIPAWNRCGIWEETQSRKQAAYDCSCKWGRRGKRGEAMLSLGRWLRRCEDRSLSGPGALWWSGKLSSKGARLPLLQPAPL